MFVVEIEQVGPVGETIVDKVMFPLKPMLENTIVAEPEEPVFMAKELGLAELAMSGRKTVPPK